MSDTYKQMELDLILEGEEELQENIMIAIESARDCLKSQEIKPVENRYEGYGLAIKAWGEIAAKEKEIKTIMKNFSVALSMDNKAAINVSASLNKCAQDLIYRAVYLAAYADKISSDLYKNSMAASDEKTPLEEYAEDAFQEAEEKGEEEEAENGERGEENEQNSDN